MVRLHSRHGWWLGMALAALVAVDALAQQSVPTSASSPTPAAVPTDSGVAAAQPLGLNFDVGVATAYLFRGYNVFQRDGQLDQHLMIAPGVSWAVFDTGLSLIYWSAYQISGSNIDANLAGGLGAEQDLIALYEYSLTDEMTLAGGLAYYFYPLADDAVVGASVPSFLEPVLSFAYSGIVDASVSALYLFGLQDVPAVRGISYLYLNPSIGKSVELLDKLSLEAKLSYGYKLFLQGNEGASNAHDVLFAWRLPFAVKKDFYITPSIGVAWTNIEGNAANPRGFEDGVALFGGLNVGAEL